MVASPVLSLVIQGLGVSVEAGAEFEQAFGDAISDSLLPSGVGGVFEIATRVFDFLSFLGL